MSYPNGKLNEPGEPYIAPYTMTFEISYPTGTNPAAPVARVVNLPAGNYIRLVMIQDRQQPRIVRLSYSEQMEPGIVTTSDQPFPEVINQSEPDGYFYYMPIETFRHDSSGVPIRQHYHIGILRCSPQYSILCPYKESEADPVALTPYQAVILFDQ